MEENNKYVNEIILKSLLLLALEAIIILVFFDNKISLLLGLLLGGGLAIIFFRMLYLNILIAMGKTEDKARRYMTVNYFIRFLITGIILYISAKSNLFNLATTTLGLLSIKFTLYINNFVTLLRDRKEGSNGH